MEQKKIEKLEQYHTCSWDGYYAIYHPNEMDFMRKINELVDAVNELREELGNLKRTIRFI